MTVTRKTAAGCAIAALIVPLAATAAFAFAPADASKPHRAVSLVVDPQRYTVASAAQEPVTARAAFDVYIPPTPAPAPVADPAPASAAAGPAAAAQSYSGEAVVAYAETFVGVVPYGWGADPSDSFGCDGLVQYVFGHFGISLPRGADNQAALGTVISADEARAGDLVWWPGRHIGIWDGAGGIIDSPDWGRYVEHHAPWASSGPPIFIRL